MPYFCYASSKENIPMAKEQKSPGGLLVGETDKNGGPGIKVVAPEGNILMGGGELILTSDTGKSDVKHEFDGKEMTPCEIASELNQEGGGVKIPCAIAEPANTTESKMDVHDVIKNAAKGARISKEENIDVILPINSMEDYMVLYGAVNYKSRHLTLNGFKKFVDKYSGTLRESHYRVFDVYLKNAIINELGIPSEAFSNNGTYIDVLPNKGIVKITFSEGVSRYFISEGDKKKLIDYMDKNFPVISKTSQNTTSYGEKGGSYPVVVETLTYKLNSSSKKMESGGNLDLRVQKFLDTIRIADNNIQLEDVTVQATPKGHWEVFRNGKKLMVVAHYLLDDETIRKYNLESKMAFGGITEADESATSKQRAIENLKSQVYKGESVGVIDMYEQAALNSGASVQEIEQAMKEAKAEKLNRSSMAIGGNTSKGKFYKEVIDEDGTKWEAYSTSSTGKTNFDIYMNGEKQEYGARKTTDIDPTIDQMRESEKRLKEFRLENKSDLPMENGGDVSGWRERKTKEQIQEDLLKAIEEHKKKIPTTISEQEELKVGDKVFFTAIDGHTYFGWLTRKSGATWECSSMNYIHDCNPNSITKMVELSRFSDEMAKGGDVKKVIRRNLPINKEYKLIDSFYTGGILENPMSCDNCNKPIANVAVLEDEDGKKFHVGMDCAETLASIKHSMQFNQASHDFSEATAIRAKVRNARKKDPNAKLIVENTYFGTIYMSMANQNGGLVFGGSHPKEFFMKHLPDFAKHISNPEKNQFVPRFHDNHDFNFDFGYFNKELVDGKLKLPRYTGPKTISIDGYRVVVSYGPVPFTKSDGTISYNDSYDVKVYKGDILVGERSFYMHRDIPKNIIYIINEYEFENFKPSSMELGGKVYYDKNMKLVKLGDLVEVKEVAGRYGQTKTYQGKITKMPDQFGSIELDGEYTVTSPFHLDHKTGKRIGYSKHDDYEHGHETYVKKITPAERNHKLDVPKRFRPTYTVRFVDYTGGKNKDKHYSSDHPQVAKLVGEDEFNKWIKDNYPNAIKMDSKIQKELVKNYDNDWYKQYPKLTVHESAPHASGYLTDYIIGYKSGSMATGGMYSAQSYQLTKEEFNYLLPVLRKKLSQSGDRYYFISDNIDDLTDMLNRLKGLYDNYEELKNMVAYKCSKEGSLKPFRDSMATGGKIAKGWEALDLSDDKAVHKFLEDNYSFEDIQKIQGKAARIWDSEMAGGDQDNPSMHRRQYNRLYKRAAEDLKIKSRKHSSGGSMATGGVAGEYKGKNGVIRDKYIEDIGNKFTIYVDGERVEREVTKSYVPNFPIKEWTTYFDSRKDAKDYAQKIGIVLDEENKYDEREKKFIEDRLKKINNQLKELDRKGNVEDKGLIKILKEEYVIQQQRLTKYDNGSTSGGSMATGGEVEFIDYKDKEIMFSPKNKYQENDAWFSNDQEFPSLEEAKRYIDSGSPMSAAQIRAYRHGVMETGGGIKEYKAEDFKSLTIDKMRKQFPYSEKEILKIAKDSIAGRDAEVRGMGDFNTPRKYDSSAQLQRGFTIQLNDAGQSAVLPSGTYYSERGIPITFFFTMQWDDKGKRSVKFAASKTTADGMATYKWIDVNNIQDIENYIMGVLNDNKPNSKRDFAYSSGGSMAFGGITKDEKEVLSQAKKIWMDKKKEALKELRKPDITQADRKQYNSLLEQANQHLESFANGSMESGGKVGDEKKYRDILKKDYESFMQALGSNIDDPKVKAFIMSGLRGKNEDAISIRTIFIPVANLSPTQNEIVMEKSLGFPLKDPISTESYLSGKDIYVAGSDILSLNGKYIIDGHHRWSQVFVLNPNAKISAKNIEGISDPIKALKATQLAIVGTTGTLPSMAGGGTNLFTVSENVLKEYVKKNLGAESLAVFKKYGKGSTADQVANYIWKNVETMKKQNKPIVGAPSRDVMPQTDNAPNALTAMLQGRVNVPMEKGGRTKTALKTYYRFFGGLLARKSIYPPFPKEDLMLWTQDKRTAKSIFDKAGLEYFDRKELSKYDGSNYALLFELHKVDITDSEWNKATMNPSANKLELIDEFYLDNGEVIEERAIDLNGRHVSKDDLKKLLYATGGKLHGFKNVKANQSIAMSEVLNHFHEYKDLGSMEAGMLYNLRNNSDVHDEVLNANGLKDQIYQKLGKKYYIVDFDLDDTGDDSSHYRLSNKAQEFIKRVDNRLETRREVKSGRDLFPETSNIPELAMAKGGKTQLQIGIKVEKEHRDLYERVKKLFEKNGMKMPISEIEFYKTIARAHIREDKYYYDKLMKYVENKKESGGTLDADSIPILQRDATWKEVKDYLSWLKNSPYEYHLDDNPYDVFSSREVADKMRSNSEVVWMHSIDGERGTNIWEAYNPISEEMENGGKTPVIDQVLYHGTNRKFTGKLKPGQAISNPTYGTSGDKFTDNSLGIFFTDNRTMAEWFAGLSDYDVDHEKYMPTGNKDGRVIEKTVVMYNPYIIDQSHKDYDIDNGEDSATIYFYEIEQAGGADQYKKNLLDKGYDGIVLRGNKKNYYEDGTYDMFVSFAKSLASGGTVQEYKDIKDEVRSEVKKAVAEGYDQVSTAVIDTATGEIGVVLLKGNEVFKAYPLKYKSPIYDIIMEEKGVRVAGGGRMNNLNTWQVYYMDNDRQKKIIGKNLFYHQAVKMHQEKNSKGLSTEYEPMSK